VATLDLRGHGDSDVEFDAFDDVAAGTDALALVEHLGGPAVLVGSSMGAGAAAWAAAERPDLVAGLVLSGPFVRNPPAGALKGVALKAMMAAMLTGPWKLAALKAYLRTLYPTRRTPDVEQHLAAMLAGVARPGRWAPFRATTRTTHAPVEARLGQVRAPAVVVMGSKDPDFPDPAAEARWIGEQLNAPVVMIEGAGHYPHSEFAEQTTPAALDLLARAFRRG
jgi:pimeloyl-ACP methyl ester carboxylesterase